MNIRLYIFEGDIDNWNDGEIIGSFEGLLRNQNHEQNREILEVKHFDKRRVGVNEVKKAVNAPAQKHQQNLEKLQFDEKPERTEFPFEKGREKEQEHQIHEKSGELTREGKEGGQ